jgi:PAS domain S-box-containing protein
MHQPSEMEVALLRVARTLAASTDINDVTAEITRTALELANATGAYIEGSTSAAGSVQVVAVAGVGTPLRGTTVPYPGSMTEEIAQSGQPFLMSSTTQIGPHMTQHVATTCRDCTGMLIPLFSEGDVIGALVLLRDSSRAPFVEDDVATATLLGDLSSVALKRRQREADVYEKQQRFQALAENAAEAILTLDSSDNILFANPAAERIFGYPLEALYTMQLTDLIPERFRARHRAGMQRYIATNVRRVAWDGIELTGLHRDGHEFPVEVTFGEFEQNGERFFTGLMRDITDRVRIQQQRDQLLERETAARAAAERQERRALSLASAGVLLSSSLDTPTTMHNLARIATDAIADWCIIDITTEDNGIQRIAGVHADPALQPALDRLIAAYPPRQSSEHPAVRSLSGGEPVILNDVTPDYLRSIVWDEEHLAHARELGVRSIMAVPLLLGTDVLGGFTVVRGPQSLPFDEDDVSFARDLATRAALAVSNARHYMAAQEARADAERGRQELERMSESKSRLIRGFSHDIKNPLGAADGYAQLLLDGLMGDLSEKQQESIGRIRAGIATALSLINDVV